MKFTAILGGALALAFAAPAAAQETIDIDCAITQASDDFPAMIVDDFLRTEGVIQQEAEPITERLTALVAPCIGTWEDPNPTQVRAFVSYTLAVLGERGAGTRLDAMGFDRAKLASLLSRVDVSNGPQVTDGDMVEIEPFVESELARIGDAGGSYEVKLSTTGFYIAMVRSRDAALSDLQQ